MAVNTNLRLTNNNLYANGKVINISEGRALLKREKITYPFKSDRDQNHVIIAGETLSSIAQKYYGDSKLWFVLADINNIYNPLDLQRGFILLIPDKDTIDNLR